MAKTPSCILNEISEKTGFNLDIKEFAVYLDEQDTLSGNRDKFYYPKNNTLPGTDCELVNGNDDCIYLCGNSLGLCPKSAQPMIDTEMKKWRQCGVMGHHVGDIPWESIGEDRMAHLAKIVGAKPNEVVLMNGLTPNLHLLMVSFYAPTPAKYKIIIEGGSFPSDFTAVRSQISFHGYDPDTALVVVHPRDGEHTLRTEDIVEAINREGEQTALVLFSGVQFCTGQFFDMKAITEAGHAKGCRVGFDLAHAVGNVEMHLHDWCVDFACWCTYKYLNSGPGAVAGAFVHERHDSDKNLKQFKGWWGVEFRKRFSMMNDDLPFIPGAMGYALCNPPVLSMLPVLASIEIFHEVGMEKVVAKQRQLTGYLELLLHRTIGSAHFEILTPSNVHERGCQLSISFKRNLDAVFQELCKRGVVCDIRRSRVIRVAPCPLYNSFLDVYKFVSQLKNCLDNDS